MIFLDKDEFFGKYPGLKEVYPICECNEIDYIYYVTQKYACINCKNCNTHTWGHRKPEDDLKMRKLLYGF